MMNKTIPERVADGAAFLDRTVPGWTARVEIKRLDMSDACKCVIGQVVAEECPSHGFDAVMTDWGSTPNETPPFRLTHPEAVALGFDYGGLDEDEAVREYADLVHEWEIAIKERRS